ncbi:MAG: hypothetical protein WDN75_16695 [Bacteroidota bacterium]
MQGNKVFNNDRTNVENPTFYVDNLAKSLLRAWKQPGDITDVPRIQTVGGLTTDPFQAQTSRYIEDGSFLRMRNVMLSYNLPQNGFQGRSCGVSVYMSRVRICSRSSSSRDGTLSWPAEH